MAVSKDNTEIIRSACERYQRECEQMAEDKIFELSQWLRLQEDTVRRIWEGAF